MKSSTVGNQNYIGNQPYMDSPSDHIRVVPLHIPLPNKGIDEVGRSDVPPQGDLFDQPGVPASAAPKLTYRNGPLLTNVQVYLIFWGKLWGTTPTSTLLMQQLNQFFGPILVGPAIDQLGEYSVAGKTIGHGALLGHGVITTNAPGPTVTDATIKSELDSWITGKVVPQNSPNTLYFIYLDPAVVSVMGGSRSCQNFCGYHSNLGGTYYAVMPFPSCSGCLGGMSTLDALTGTSSHELCEAITDPVPGTGWYDDINGEIGDICAWKFKNVGGFNVQLEWSNQQNSCV